MKTIQEKRIYNSPKVEKLKLDNEISLILESTPPAGPEEGYLKGPDFFKNDPYNKNFG